MKTNLSLFVALFCCQNALSTAMMPPLAEPKFVSLTTEPIGIFFGDFHIHGEFRISDALSIVVPVTLYNANWSPFRALTSLDPSSFNGITFPGWIAGTGCGINLYPFGKALGGGLYVHFLLFGGVGQTFATNAHLGLIQQRYHLGYTIITEFGFVLDLYAGFQQSNFSMVASQGFVNVAGLSLGYAI
jgi:hypothetical protein